MQAFTGSLDVVVVRQALEQLYDSVELAGSQLGAYFPQINSQPTLVQRAQLLRNLLIEAIETLRPPRSMPASAGGNERMVEILSLRYISGYSVDDIAAQLSLSPRQVYRDLRRGEEHLTRTLESQLYDSQSLAAHPPQSAFQQEIDALTSQAQATDLLATLQSGISTIRPLLEQQHTVLDFAPPRHPIRVFSTPGLLSEVLIQLLSAIVQQCGPEHALSLKVDADQTHARLEITIHNPDFSPTHPLLQNALHTAQLLGFAYATRALAEHKSHLFLLSFVLVPPLPILIVEDNPGIAELYRRHLERSDWQVFVISKPDRVIEMAQEIRPAAIILDILMPEKDGWSVLQTLKLSPVVTAIPVIICSVINDPELASALGAAATLPKPLSRLELLSTLQAVTSSHNAALPAVK